MTERRRDYWDEVIDKMPDTHGATDHFETTRDAVRWAMGEATRGLYWVETDEEVKAG